MNCYSPLSITFSILYGICKFLVAFLSSKDYVMFSTYGNNGWSEIKISSTLSSIIFNYVIAAWQLSPAKPCNVTLCDSPTCRCSSTSLPNGMSDEEVPQFIVLSFDDAVTVTNYPFYKEIAADISNPNGCDMKMTFFVTHENTDYTLVNDLHRSGHEVGVNSVTWVLNWIIIGLKWVVIKHDYQ